MPFSSLVYQLIELPPTQQIHTPAQAYIYIYMRIAEKHNPNR